MVRNLVIVAGLLLAGAGIFVKMIDRVGTGRPAAAVATTEAPRPSRASAPNYRSVTIRPDSRGHFQVDARVEGRNLSLMVDTGASVIALRASSAAQLGIHPARREFTAIVHTANGSLRAARTQLSMVEVGGMIVRDVDALIMPDEALGENLLGLSFLRRLRRFEYADGKLVMEQ